MHDFLVFTHIFFVALLLFAVGAINFSSVMLHRTSSIHEFGVYLSLSKTAGMITPIATILLTIFGIWAAEEIGFPLDQAWLIAAYVTTAAAIVVPVLTLKRWGEAAGKLMPQAMSEGRILDEQKALVTGPRHLAVDLFMNGLLVFILYDMVYKPSFGT